MLTLVYKRTHNGDPDSSGGFGIYDCMKSVRQFPFKNVIGIGGVGREPRSHGIDRRINWIGLGARQQVDGLYQYPVVTFDHFVLFEQSGQILQTVASELARRMYSRHAPRYLLYDINEMEQAEIESILRMAKEAPPSKWTPFAHRSLCSPETPSRRSKNCSCSSAPSTRRSDC
jgi:hypothetical protein